jgi:SAM-dependent methyltransferase
LYGNLLLLKVIKKEQTTLKLKNIDNGNTFDFGKTSANYARFRDIYPDVFFETLNEMRIGTAGQKVLDLGTGTGVLPRFMNKYGADFTGSDVSAEQIEQAKILSDGMTINYVISASEDMNFPEKSFDVITALQCAWYFEREKLYPKMKNILKENGIYAEMGMIYLPRESEIAAGSEALVHKYNPAWNSNNYGRDFFDITPKRYNELVGDIFVLEQVRLIEAQIPFTRETWHGRMKTLRGIGASNFTPEQIEAWSDEHFAFMQTQPETFTIPHLIQICMMRKKTAETSRN